MKSRKFTDKFKGKGYYIALGLCAVAIAVTGVLYLRSNREEEPVLQDPMGSTPGDPAHDDVPAGATTPDVTTPTVAPPEPLKTGLPLSGETLSDYAMEALSYNETTRDWRVHNGIDIAAEAGTAVCAAADGTVYTVYEDDTMGHTVVIRHQDGYTTTYSSLDADIAVQPGDTVKLGQAIGTVGNSAMVETALGDHLHFGVSLNGRSMDPSDFFALNS